MSVTALTGSPAPAPSNMLGGGGGGWGGCGGSLNHVDLEYKQVCNEILSAHFHFLMMLGFCKMDKISIHEISLGLNSYYCLQGVENIVVSIMQSS